MPSSASMATALSWLAISLLLLPFFAGCGGAETSAIASMYGFSRGVAIGADRIPRLRQTPSRQNPHGRVDAMTCLAIGKFRSPESNAAAVALVQRFGAGGACLALNHPGPVAGTPRFGTPAASYFRSAWS